MNLLYLSYWGFNEGLTASTVFPNLRILSSFPNVNKIIFCSIERDGQKKEYPNLDIEKMEHIPLYSKNIKINALNKFYDILIFRNALIKIAKQNDCNVIICRSSLAGAIGHLVHKKLGLPYYVESFEPHADYMIEGGEWTKYGIKSLIEKYWSKKQIESAAGLMPVSVNYKNYLIAHSISANKIKVAPCCVPLEKFSFLSSKRLEMRKLLGIADNTFVGIYVGKFGGIYYDKVAFQLFKRTFDFFKGNFFLIILSPQDKQVIEQNLDLLGISKRKYFVERVPHNTVPDYLSAADFAYSPVKSTPSRKYCSAIKHGEYWANGLPILMPDNIGDDSEIIKSTKLGAVFNMEDKFETITALNWIKKLLLDNSRGKLAMEIGKLASKYRNFDLIVDAYQYFFTKYKLKN